MQKLALVFQKNPKKFIKIKEVEAILGFETFFGEDSRSIVFTIKNDGDVEFEVDGNIDANCEVINIRADKPLPKRVVTFLEEFSEVDSDDYNSDEDEDEFDSDDEDMDEDEDVQEPISSQNDGPVKVEGQEKEGILEILRTLYGDKIPEGVGIQIVKGADPKPVEKPVTGYISNNGDTATLTLTELRLIELLFKTVKELSNNPSLAQIAIDINEGLILPKNAKSPLTIENVQYIIEQISK